MAFMEKLINRDNLPDMFNVSSLKAKNKLSYKRIFYALKGLEKKGEVIKISRGVYSKSHNPFYIASRFFNGYIGFSSALYLLESKNETTGTIYVCSFKNHVPIKVLDKIIINVNLKGHFYGTKSILMDGNEILVSTFPKTLFDMLYKVRYADFQSIFISLNNRETKKEEWAEFFSYVKHSNISVIRRAGYILEDIAPSSFIKELKTISDGKRGPSFLFDHSFTNYSKEWKIFDSLNIKRWKNGI